MTQQPGIRVSATGTAAAAPDIFVAVLAAQATSTVPKAAMDAAAAAIGRMREVAVRAAAEPTSGPLSLHQGYDRDGQPRGVLAELVLTLRTGDPAGGGDLVAACIEAGGEQARLQNTSFEHGDPAALLASAREAAFETAAGRARQLAALARRPLGVVRHVVEEAGVWQSVPLAHHARDSAELSMKTDPGQLDVTVTLTLSWDWA